MNVMYIVRPLNVGWHWDGHFLSMLLVNRTFSLCLLLILFQYAMDKVEIIHFLYPAHATCLCISSSKSFDDANSLFRHATALLVWSLPFLSSFNLPIDIAT